MAVSKSLVLLLVALAAAVAQSARVARQAHGGWPHGAAVHGEDDGSYWPGKYADDPAAPAAPAAPAWPHAAPAWNHAAPAWNPAVPAWNPAAPAWNHAAPAWNHAAPAGQHWGADDGSYYPGKYGVEDQQ